MTSEISPHIWLPEPKLSFHPEREGDCDIHPLRGLLRFGPHSAGLVPGPIRIATRSRRLVKAEALCIHARTKLDL